MLIGINWNYFVKKRSLCWSKYIQELSLDEIKLCDKNNYPVVQRLVQIEINFLHEFKSNRINVKAFFKIFSVPNILSSIVFFNVRHEDGNIVTFDVEGLLRV